METFEETAGRALDTLYPGALFLTGGNEPEAESLVVQTVLQAMKTPTRPSHDSTRWLESMLAARFLGEAAAPPAEVGPWVEVGPVDRVQSVDLLRGSSAIPTWARSAIWLVLLKQWSYEDAAEALNISLDALRQMLEFRSVLAREVLWHEQTDRAGGASAS